MRIKAPYFLVVKSISFPTLPPAVAGPVLSQVHAPADLSPHAHEASDAGLTFSVAALSHEHWRAGLAPQEQVAFWAVKAEGVSSGWTFLRSAVWGERNRFICWW